ncbi:TPA: YxiF family protein [Bacillus cereus]
MSNMNKSRIEILKMKAKRNGSRKELLDELSNIVTVSMDSFMDPESNDLFCKDLFNTLAQTSNIKNFGNTNYEENRRLSIVLLKETAKTVKFPVDQGRLFFFKGGKFEAVKLNIAEVFENLEELSTISRFLTGYADFVLAGDDLEFGIVIERTEYHYEFSMWGVSTI